MSTELQIVMKQLKKNMIIHWRSWPHGGHLGCQLGDLRFRYVFFFGQFKYVFIINLFLWNYLNV